MAAGRDGDRALSRHEWRSRPDNQAGVLSPAGGRPRRTPRLVEMSATWAEACLDHRRPFLAGGKSRGRGDQAPTGPERPPSEGAAAASGGFGRVLGPVEASFPPRFARRYQRGQGDQKPFGQGEEVNTVPTNEPKELIGRFRTQGQSEAPTLLRPPGERVRRPRSA